MAKAKQQRKSWKNKSDSEIIEYVRTEFNGMPYNQLRKNHLDVFAVIRRRGLFSKLLEESVLVKTYPNPSREELKETIIEKYAGMSLTDFKEHRAISSKAIRKGLLKELVSEGIIKRKNRNLRDVPDEELKHYVRSNYYGDTIEKLSKSDSPLYREIGKRELTDYFVDEGTLVKLRRKNK